jgi:hypothetical protein
MTVYIFEPMNDTAVGPFETRELAQAWMMRVVPPEDQDGTPENKKHDDYECGWRIITREEISEYTDHAQFETPKAAALRYAECYDEYYPNFKKPK